MRTYQLSNTTITYPDPIIWIYDSNVIELESTGPVGAEIIVTEPTGESKTLIYYSELSKLMFTLDDIILSLFKDNLSPWGIRVTVYENHVSTGSLSFAVTVYNGKSFITRCHGLQSTYYAYNTDELQKMQVYSCGNGSATMGQYGYNCYKGINSYNLTGPIHNTEGTYELRLQGNHQTPPTAVVEGASPVDPTTSVINFSWTSGWDPDSTYGGDIWNDNVLVFPCTKKVIYETHCSDYSFIELMYIDTDGCRRFIGGKLAQEEDEVKDSAVNELDTDVWSHNPHRWINSSAKTIKVAFSDIEKAAYPEDIMYSDQIWMRDWTGEWQEVRLKSTKFEQKGEDYLDFELEIYTHER